MAGEGLAELGDGEGLVQHPVHPGLLPAERLGAHHMRGQGDDAFGRASLARLVLADTARRLVAVHLRHGDVHQDQIVFRHMCLAQGLQSVAGEIGGDAETGQGRARDLAIDRAVIGDQHAGLRELRQKIAIRARFRCRCGERLPGPHPFEQGGGLVHADGKAHHRIGQSTPQRDLAGFRADGGEGNHGFGAPGTLSARDEALGAHQPEARYRGTPVTAFLGGLHEGEA